MLKKILNKNNTGEQAAKETVIDIHVSKSNPELDVIEAGQIVRGYVLVTNKSPLTIRAIRLRISFMEESNFKKGERLTKNLSLHYDTFYYANTKVTLYGSQPDEKETHILEPGSHEFKFSFKVPDNCPNYVKGHNSGITYDLAAFAGNNLF